MKRKQLQDMNLLDDFLFNALISNEEFGETFARYLLETILGRPLKRITIQTQRPVYPTFPEEHGIRVDAYIEEDHGEASGDIIYDLEPDTGAAEKAFLPRRARYYHVMNDSKLLKSGDSYEKLLRAYVIFIMPYDPFDMGRMVYTIQNACKEEPSLPYDDGAVTIFLYTRGKRLTESPALEKLLNYMEHTKQQNAVDENLRQIQQMVDSVKNSREARRAEMKFHEWVERERKEARREGREEGRAEGREEGRAEGREEGRAEGREEGRDEERRNTERERLRAEAAEEENRRLKAQLEKLGNTNE